MSLIFPRRCPICDNAVAPFGELVCTNCLNKARIISGATCYKCGKPLNDDSEEYCLDCKKHRHKYKTGRALFEYKSIADSIYRYKYKGRREYARWYGQCMAQQFGEWLCAIKPDALVPVPIHKSKFRSRGYNQAELLARELSFYTGIPTQSGLVERAKKTKPLKDYTPEERNNILRGAFKLTVNDVKLDTIVIIDDIYTTGSTIDEIADIFAKHGVKNIYFLTLAIGKGI